MIISQQEAKTLARPIGAMQPDKLQAYINEAEQQVKRAIGDGLFAALNDTTIAATEPYKTLLTGGTYTDGGRTYCFRGLKVATAYLVNAKAMMTGDIESTRYGYVQKSGDYSQAIDGGRLSSAYNEIVEEGQIYLREAIRFARCKNLLTCGGGVMPSAGIRIKKIN